jgi:hypothetical protein
LNNQKMQDQGVKFIQAKFCGDTVFKFTLPETDRLPQIKPEPMGKRIHFCFDEKRAFAFADAENRRRGDESVKVWGLFTHPESDTVLLYHVIDTRDSSNGARIPKKFVHPCILKEIERKETVEK